MTKQSIMKNFLESNIDFNKLQEEKDNSWMYNHSPKEFFYNGLVSNYATFNLIKEAISNAGYKFPNSNRTWETADKVVRELIIKNIK